MTLPKEELVVLVRRLMNAEGSEQELDEIERLVRDSVPHPDISDLIYHPKVEMTAEEIVELALTYQPIPLPSGTQREQKK